VVPTNTVCIHQRRLRHLHLREIPLRSHQANRRVPLEFPRAYRLVDPRDSRHVPHRFRRVSRVADRADSRADSHRRNRQERLHRNRRDNLQDSRLAFLAPSLRDDQVHALLDSRVDSRVADRADSRADSHRRNRQRRLHRNPACNQRNQPVIQLVSLRTRQDSPRAYRLVDPRDSRHAPHRIRLVSRADSHRRNRRGCLHRNPACNQLPLLLGNLLFSHQQDLRCSRLVSRLTSLQSPLWRK